MTFLDKSEDSAAKLLTIDELNTLVSDSLTRNPLLMNIAITGEISELRIQGDSGHIYFSLRDSSESTANNKNLMSASVRSQVSCTFFANAARSLGFVPKSGDKVNAYGSISVYKPRGAYNFNIRRLEKAGLGDLHLQIAALRKKIIEEGLCDPQKKRSLPLIPGRIGIVTGLNTAAFRDILKQVRDRFPGINILAASALVQGEKAAESIVAAIEEITKTKYHCDVIIVGRGGGSPEDLLPFSDEKVVRAIAASPVPVISAVGHQIDHPLSDDVADVAAATPTDAAKIAVPDLQNYLRILNSYGSKLDSMLLREIKYCKERLRPHSLNKVFKDPMVLLQDRYLMLDELQRNLTSFFEDNIDGLRDRLTELPPMEISLERRLSFFRGSFEKKAAKLEAYSPLMTLRRGYSIVYQQGQIIRTAAAIEPEKEIEIQFSSGKIRAMPLQSRKSETEPSLFSE